MGIHVCSPSPHIHNFDFQGPTFRVQLVSVRNTSRSLILLTVIYFVQEFRQVSREHSLAFLSATPADTVGCIILNLHECMNNLREYDEDLLQISTCSLS